MIHQWIAQWGANFETIPFTIFFDLIQEQGSAPWLTSWDTEAGVKRGYTKKRRICCRNETSKLIQIEHFRTLGASDSRVDIVYKFYCPFDAARPTRAWAVRGAQPKNWGRETFDCSHLFTPFRQLLAQVETNLWPVEYDIPQDIGLGRFWYYKPRTNHQPNTASELTTGLVLAEVVDGCALNRCSSTNHFCHPMESLDRAFHRSILQVMHMFNMYIYI